MKHRIIHLFLSLLLLSVFTIPTSQAATSFPAPEEGCLSCHQGIEPIKDHESQMAQQIYAMGGALGDANGCVVCHGGNPTEKTNVKEAHSGAPAGSFLGHFTPTPGLFR